MKLLEAQGLRKTYGETTLFSDLRLTVEAGECVAITGGNGAGKTTLLRMLAGLIRVDSGSLWHAPALSAGYIPEHFPKSALRTLEYLTHMGCIEGYPRETARAKARALLADFGMSSMEKTPMRHLSKGSLQKAGVVQALLSRHQLLLLDEPLSGQDAASQQVFLRKMLDCKQEGTAILLSCHEPFLIHRLTDRVFCIENQGLQELSANDPRLTEYVTMTFAAANSTALPHFDFPLEVQETGSEIRIHAPAPQSNGVVLDMIQAGFQIKEFHYANDR